MNKEKAAKQAQNNNFLSPNSITSTPKKEHRTTKLLLDVNEFGAFSNVGNIDRNIPNTNSNGLLTPPSSLDDKNKYLNNYKNSSNGMLAPPSSNSSLSLKEDSTDTIKANKHSSFINPLMDMKFDVGGLFGDGDKNGDDIFGDIMSKFDDMDVNVDSSKDDLQNQNRLSQDTIKMKHISNVSTGTIKASDSIKASGTIKSSGTIKTSGTIKNSGTIKSSGTVKASHNKHDSQDTIKLNKENSVKKIDSFDNQLVQNLNDNPAIVIDKTFLSNNNEDEEDDAESNRGFDPDIYKEDDKIDFSDSNDWDSPWRSGKSKNSPSSMKSSQSKLSAFSSFTLRSSKKLGKMTKKFYKKLIKQKENPQFPLSPLDIPESYNEKERAFEEMILRDDTISLSLSNPNGSLTSTFADKAFPLTEDVNGNSNENSNEMENNALANRSFVSSASSEDDDVASKKRRHRNGINFEEALKEGNNFRVSLANM